MTNCIPLPPAIIPCVQGSFHAVGWDYILYHSGLKEKTRQGSDKLFICTLNLCLYASFCSRYAAVFELSLLFCSICPLQFYSIFKMLGDKMFFILCCPLCSSGAQLVDCWFITDTPLTHFCGIRGWHSLRILISQHDFFLFSHHFVMLHILLFSMKCFFHCVCMKRNTYCNIAQVQADSGLLNSLYFTIFFVLHVHTCCSALWKLQMTYICSYNKNKVWKTLCSWVNMELFSHI